MPNVVIFILFLIGFVLLVYNVILLFKRKEYENQRVYPGYNILILGVVLLGLATLIKTIKFGVLSFSESVVDSLIYFDIVSNLILIPLFVVSFLVAMLVFREV